MAQSYLGAGGFFASFGRVLIAGDEVVLAGSTTTAFEDSYQYNGDGYFIGGEAFTSSGAEDAPIRFIAEARLSDDVDLPPRFIGRTPTTSPTAETYSAVTAKCVWLIDVSWIEVDGIVCDGAAPEWDLVDGGPVRTTSALFDSPLRSLDGMRPGEADVVLPTFRNWVALRNTSHITIRGSRFRFAAQIGVNLFGTDHARIEDNEMMIAIRAQGTDTVAEADLPTLARDWDAFEPGEVIYITQQSHDNLVRNNVAHTAGHAVIVIEGEIDTSTEAEVVGYQPCVHPEGSEGDTVAGNVIVGNDFSNRINRVASFGLCAHDNIIERNWFHDSSDLHLFNDGKEAVKLQGRDNVFRYNRFTDNALAGLRVEATFNTDPHARGLSIHHNRFERHGREAIQIVRSGSLVEHWGRYGDAADGDISGTAIFDNVLTDSGLDLPVPHAITLRMRLNYGEPTLDDADMPLIRANTIATEDAEHAFALDLATEEWTYDGLNPAALPTGGHPDNIAE